LSGEFLPAQKPDPTAAGGKLRCTLIHPGGPGRQIAKGFKKDPFLQFDSGLPPPGDLHLVKIAPHFIIAE
jgi:hypothetical protein